MRIDIRDLTVHYFDDEATLPAALDRVSLNIPSGQCVLVTGESGCGKSTLLRSINGLVPHFFDTRTAGSVEIDGIPIGQFTTSQLSHQVGYVFQDPRSQFFTFDVRSELAFPCENAGLESAKIQARIRQVADLVGVSDLLDRRLDTLSSGEKQKVAIATALMPRPRILLFDEPTANLDSESVQTLQDIISRLKVHGLTILIADHRLEYLRHLADRILVLHSGRLTLDLTAAELAQKDTQWFTHHALRQVQSQPLGCSPARVNPDQIGLRIRNARFSYPGKETLWVINDLILPSHGVIGITGTNGCGKTTLMKVILGLLRCPGATIEIAGKKRSARQRNRLCAYVMQDVEYQLLGSSVAEEMLIGAPKQAGHEATRRSELLLKTVDLTAFSQRHPLTLSGGQKQRLGIALGCMKGAPIIGLDEPTSGLDARNMHRISQLLKDLAAQGHLILTITHDEEFAAKTFDHVLTISDGRVCLQSTHYSVTPATSVENGDTPTPQDSQSIATCTDTPPTILRRPQ